MDGASIFHELSAYCALVACGRRKKYSSSLEFWQTQQLSSLAACQAIEKQNYSDNHHQDCYNQSNIREYPWPFFEFASLLW
jgi:hypothetical protein